jgi:hypothetical protein
MLKYKNFVILDINNWDESKTELFQEEFLTNHPPMNFDSLLVLNGKFIEPIVDDSYKTFEAKNIFIFSFENLEDAILFKMRWA